ncbi:MAG: outer membrane lipoprotein carrier protein LolA [Thermotogae bacterium]|nr:outer membrane lipoprotein carrier protein LolA [Thermotogota bacterium]
MRKFLVLVIAVMAFTALAVDFNDVLKASEKLESVVCTIKAYNYSAGRKSTAEFEFYYVRNGKMMRIEYRNPKNMAGSIIAMDGEYFYTYIPAMNRKIKKPLKDSARKNPGKDMGLLYNFVLGNLKQAVEGKKVEFLGEDSHLKAFAFKIGDGKEFQKVWFDEKEMFPVKVEIYLKGKLGVKIEVEKFELNVKIDESVFKPF